MSFLFVYKLIYAQGGIKFGKSDKEFAPEECGGQLFKQNEFSYSGDITG
jgi:hypothetical protein